MSDHDGPQDHAQLRDLLHDAVADVLPRSGIDEIRDQTRSLTPVRHRRRLIAVATAAAATAAVVFGAVQLADAGDPTSPGPAASVHPETVPVYYAGATSTGQGLFRELVDYSPSNASPLEVAVERAVAGSPADPDYRSLWPAGASVSSATYADGVITIDLIASDPAILRRDPGAGIGELAVQQVVHTAQATVEDGTPPVRFEIRGEPADAVLGVPAGASTTRADSMTTLAPVWIVDPAEGSLVKSGFTVNGVAAAFEGTVQWKLMAGPRVVTSGFATAQECCTHSPYSFTVKAPPGSYTLVVSNTDPSGGAEGGGVDSDTKDVTITE